MQIHTFFQIQPGLCYGAVAAASLHPCASIKCESVYILIEKIENCIIESSTKLNCIIDYKKKCYINNKKLVVMLS